MHLTPESVSFPMIPNDQYETVTTATTSYPVRVAPHLLASLPHYLQQHDIPITATLWLVSDSNVFPHYGHQVEMVLQQAGYCVQTHIIPAGESSKQQAHLWQLYTWMITGGVERRDCVVALGGGVVGDMAGFAAATVLRGIDVVQLPTTLLAMVDASIGGKTGINHPQGKNLIGAFHQPRMVLADTHTLSTLPPRELRAGWAEVIKHGVIFDATLFDTLEANSALYTSPDGLSTADETTQAAWGATIRQAAAVKVAVVSNDEREQGQRIILNYGHTLGHALEAITHYNTYLHGEAVAIGMHAAAHIAAQLDMLAWDDVARQQQLLETYGLPTTFPANCNSDVLIAHTLHDKKVQQRRVRWVLPTAIGQVVVRDDVPEAVVRRAIVPQ